MAIALVGSVQTNADSLTGWASGNLDSELSYQGSGSVGGKAGSGTTRFIHTGTVRNFSVGGGNDGDHIIVILGSLTPGKLDTKTNGGLGIICGTSSTVYGEWYVDGSDTKSPTSLFLPYIIDPATDFDSATGLTTTGNPAQLSAADAFGGRFDATSGIMGNFNNALVDQITIGTGLRATGAEDMGGFITADEGTLANRYGYLTTREGVIYYQGKIYLGSSGSSVTFDDSDRVIIFPDVTVASDFFEIVVENASSTVSMESFTINAPGAAKFALTYTSASDWTISNSSIDGSRLITMGPNMTLQDTKISNSGQIVLNGGTITGGQIISSTNANGALFVDTAAEMAAVSGVSFTQGAAGHAIEITSTGTYTFDSLTFSGYGADGTTNASIYNNSGGAVTINIINGGDTPTVRNAASSTTTVNNTVVVSVTVVDASGSPIENTRVYVTAAAGGDLTAGAVIINGLTNASGVIEDTGFNFTNPQPITGRARKSSGSPFYKTGIISGTITSSGFGTSVVMILDE